MEPTTQPQNSFLAKGGVTVYGRGPVKRGCALSIVIEERSTNTGTFSVEVWAKFANCEALIGSYTTTSVPGRVPASPSRLSACAFAPGAIGWRLVVRGNGPPSDVAEIYTATSEVSGVYGVTKVETP